MVRVMSTIAKVQHIYRHCQGGEYIVEQIAHDSSNPPQEVVVYREVHGSKVWVRPRTEFEGMHPSGVPLFELISALTRLEWTEYFIDITHLIAQRATCDRKRVGAVFVKDNRIIATGYNGSPPGLPHCDEVGHDIIITDGRENCVRTVHAEQNGIYQAAQYGATLVDTVVYVNTFPCWNCAKALLSVRVAKIIYDADYNNDSRVFDAFNRAGVPLEKFVRESVK
jgi:dCMP deaminase